MNAHIEVTGDINNPGIAKGEKRTWTRQHHPLSPLVEGVTMAMETNRNWKTSTSIFPRYDGDGPGIA